MLKHITRAFSSSQRVPLRTFAASTPLRRPLDMERVDTTDRLGRLRQLMAQHKVDIYSMPST